MVRQRVAHPVQLRHRDALRRLARDAQPAVRVLPRQAVRGELVEDERAALPVVRAEEDAERGARAAGALCVDVGAYAGDEQARAGVVAGVGLGLGGPDGRKGVGRYGERGGCG